MAIAAGDTILAEHFAFKGVSVYKDTNTSLTSGVWGAINFEQENFDSDGFHSTVTNTDRLTIPTGMGGKYVIGASLSNVNNGAIGIRLLKNGSAVGYFSVAAANPDAFGSGVFLLDLAAGDYISLEAQSGTSGQQVDGNAQNTFWCYRLLP